jgi:hypothetical protein
LTSADLIYGAVLAAAERCEVLDSRVRASAQIHLAVMREPYLSFVMDGSKLVESRFGRTRQPPFRAVHTGDLLLFKQSSGPVVACATVTNAMYFELDTTPLAVIRDRFAPLIRALPEFWDDKGQSRFASLFRIEEVTQLVPFEVPKRDRRGWVVVNSPRRQASLL